MMHMSHASYKYIKTGFKIVKQKNYEKYPDSERININQETSFLGFEGYKNAIDLADVVILTTPPAFRPLHF